ncbi:MAG: response regulator [Planctomycetota bacterium]
MQSNSLSSIKLLILDVLMPKMNGPAVYERIRQINPQINVLFMSGYTVEGIHDKILKEGLPFIPKLFVVFLTKWDKSGSPKVCGLTPPTGLLLSVPSA